MSVLTNTLLSRNTLVIAPDLRQRFRHDLRFLRFIVRGVHDVIRPGGLTCDWWAAVNFHFHFHTMCQAGSCQELQPQ